MLVLVLVATMACGSSGSPAGHAVGQITLTVSGGFTGWSRQLVVDGDGIAHLNVTRGPSPARGPHAVPPQTLARLRSIVSDPAFAQLAADYPAPAGSADVQSYTVTAEVDGRHLETTTYDAAATPQILSDVVGLLTGIMSSFDEVAASSCTTGYSPSQPVTHLGVADAASARTVRLCASIFVILEAPANGAQWQFVQSSDTNVLEVVPLPLPHPPGGGTEAVYLAKRIGSARLFAETTAPTCPSGAFCPMLPGWSVTVNVIS